MIVVALLVTACRDGVESEPLLDIDTVWKTEVPETGISSPMIADLNGDGVGDVLVGHGLEGERGGLTAIDGKTGTVLWVSEVPDEVFTTTPLVDLNGDGVVDPLVGGRTLIGGITALNGRNGETLWALPEVNRDSDFPQTNFNSPVRLPDQDDDGVPDFLVTQSGGQEGLRFSGLGPTQ